ALLARADSDCLLNRQDEDLPVADLAGASVLQDHLLHWPGVSGLDDDLDLELRAQMDRELRAPVVLGDSLLPPGAFVLGDRDAREAAFEQLRTDRLERLVSDEGLDFLHRFNRLLSS